MSEASPTAGAAPASPIADVSYRHYDGPLRWFPPRWWVIARSAAVMPLRKWWFWTPAAFSWLSFVIGGFSIYSPYLFGRGENLQQLVTMSRTARSIEAWLYESFHWSLFPVFILALLVGSSVIASDNRSNALQIYFSKPVTKADYLAGKWLGLFLPIFLVGALPSLVLYVFAAAVTTSEGFAKAHPFLWLNGIGIALFVAAIHTSALVGISAWSKRPMLVGGLYAGLYMGLGFVVSILSSILQATQGREISTTVAHLSLPGLMRGFAQNEYHTTPMFDAMRSGGQAVEPQLGPVLAVAGAIVVIGIAAAALRVRAVDVVES